MAVPEHKLPGRGIIGIYPNDLQAPIEVLMELTYRCNLRCKHCFASAVYIKEGYGDASNELTTSEIKTLIDQLVSMGIISVNLSGGEPLLRNDIFEILEYAEQKSIRACLLTNAMLIDDNVAERLKKLGIYKIEANLDGHTAELYDDIRGVEGAFERTIKGINAVLKQEIPLRVNVLLCKQLFPHLEQIAHLAAELGVRELAVSPLRNAGRAPQYKDELAYSPVEYGIVLSELELLGKLIKEHYGKKLILVYESEEIREVVNPAQVFPGCGAGRFHCTITPTGNVKPCPAFDSKDARVIAGNIKEQNFRDIWTNADIFKKLRSADIPICKSCPKSKGCMGGCRVHAYIVYGDVNSGPDIYCKRILQGD